MVQKITRNIDADTFGVDDESTRVLGINTEESVAVNSDRNTEAGAESSDRAKVIAPVGTEVTTEGEGKGKFGRDLRDVKIQTGQGEVDYGLVALDQSMSKYNIDYGTHPDPEQHDVFKEYYSDDAPYQYADVKKPLEPEEYEALSARIAEYTEAEQDFTDGNIDRPTYEAALHAAYGDSAKVARLRYQNMKWQRHFDMDKYDGTDRMAYDWAHQSPRNQEVYDRAVRNTHTGFRKNPEQEVSFWKGVWQSTETMFSSLNDMAVLTRYSDLKNAREYGDDDFDVSDEELVKGIPVEYHSIVMQEAENYGDDAAMQRRDNLIVELNNAQEISDMPLVTQIATAIPAILLSPATLIGGAKVAQGAAKAGRSIDSIMAAGRMRNLAVPSKVAVWAAAGSAEAGIAAVPRLTQDTFNSMDMLNEMKWGAAFGAGLGAVGAVGRRKKYQDDMNFVMKNMQNDTVKTATNPQQFKVYTPPKQPAIIPLEGTIQHPVPMKVEVTPAQLSTQANANVDNILNKFVPTKQSSSVASKVGAVGSAGQSFTQKMLDSKSPVLNWVGEHVLELPQGYGGKRVRQASAALEQNSLKTRYLTQTQPDYHKLVGQYASENGKRTVGKFMAQHSDKNPMAQKFNRDILKLIEARRQGRTLPNVSPSVAAMADSMEKSMTHMFDDMVEAGVNGFTRDRRITNYVPQLWSADKLNASTAKHGDTAVAQMLAKGYLSSKHNDIETMTDAMNAATALMKNLRDDSTGDLAMPSDTTSRAKQRIDIDTSITDGNLSLLDIMEDDIPTIMAKYTNRAAGSTSLAKRGLYSDADVEAMKSRLTDPDEIQAFTDAIDIIMGRPTREGLAPEMREIKDAVAQSKMGGLGMSQLSEAGTVLARTMMQLFNDPAAFKKVWAMAGESTDNVQLMRETQALSGISNEVHLLDRQAVHLDQQAMSEIKGVRKVVAGIVQKATFGSLKAPAGYILAQGSGFNMIRRFERRLANASFMIDTAKAFKDGTGVMSEARMKDIGLDPQDATLKRMFRDVVEYDENGVVSKLNIDKWDKEALNRYHLAMYRDDAQVVQQTIGGEMPQWINKPMMTVLAQFKQQAILANQKQLARNLQFADKEAVLAVTMNMAMAGMTRTAKFGTLGAATYAVTGGEQGLDEAPWEKDYWDAEKYVSQFGFFPDIGHMAYDISEMEDPFQGAQELATQEIPMLGWMKDYYDIGAADTVEEKANAVKGVAILGNIQFADIIYNGVESALED